MAVYFQYEGFKHAPKATEISRKLGILEMIIGAPVVLVGLGGLISLITGEYLTAILCILLVVAVFFGYGVLRARVINPRIYALARREQAEFAEMIRRANEDPVEPEVDEKQLLINELNQLLDAETVSEDDLLRIGELTKILESMGVTVS